MTLRFTISFSNQLYAAYFCFEKNIFPHLLNFKTKIFYLTQFPVIMNQFSATDIFNTSIWDLPRPRLIQKEGIYLLC